MANFEVIKNDKPEKPNYVWIIILVIIFIILIVGMFDSFGGGTKEEQKVLGTWSSSGESVITIKSNGKCYIESTANYKNISSNWWLKGNKLYINRVYEFKGEILGKKLSKNYNETLEFILNDNSNTMTRTDIKKVYYKN